METKIRESYDNNYCLEVYGKNAKKDLRKILSRAYTKDEVDYFMEYGAVNTFNNMVYIVLNKAQIKNLGLNEEE